MTTMRAIMSTARAKKFLPRSTGGSGRSRRGWPAMASAGTATNAPCGARASSSSRRCRSEEHTSELQSLMRISYAVFCLKKKKYKTRKKYVHKKTKHQDNHNENSQEKTSTTDT